MSRITITIDTDGAAFEGDNYEPEVIRILTRLSERIGGDLDGYKLRDINGNTVGAVKVSR